MGLLTLRTDVVSTATATHAWPHGASALEDPSSVKRDATHRRPVRGDDARGRSAGATQYAPPRRRSSHRFSSRCMKVPELRRVDLPAFDLRARWV